MLASPLKNIIADPPLLAASPTRNIMVNPLRSTSFGLSDVPSLVQVQEGFVHLIISALPVIALPGDF